VFERGALLRRHLVQLSPGRGICKNLSGFLQLPCVVSIGGEKFGRRFEIRPLLIYLVQL
jgi:hypothetical protein